MERDVHESVHRDTFMKVTNKMLCSFNPSKTPADSYLGEYYQIL
jgi:hypothetical protein